MIQMLTRIRKEGVGSSNGPALSIFAIMVCTFPTILGFQDRRLPKR